MDNLLVQATERISHGWVDPRAVFGGDPTRDYWHTIWMAVSCCCGIEGPTVPVEMLEPEPRLPRCRVYRGIRWNDGTGNPLEPLLPV